MTPQSISTAAAIVLSLLFSYVPGLSNWYGTQDPVHKRLIMLGLLVAVAAGSFALACAGWAQPFNVNLTCDQPGTVALLQSLVMALVANQSTYLITPRRNSK